MRPFPLGGAGQFDLRSGYLLFQFCAQLGEGLHLRL